MRIPKQTLAKIIPETCGAIIAALTSEYMKVNGMKSIDFIE
jgi:hypothetical protein